MHRPRYRGRLERAAQIPSWDVTSLLNKQDVVGQVEKAPGPPDVVIISSDFGRQKSYGIFKAIQKYRRDGLKIVGLSDEWDECEDGLDPKSLCDIHLSPPYKTIEFREMLRTIFEDIRGEVAPTSDLGEDEEDEQ